MVKNTEAPVITLLTCKFVASRFVNVDPAKLMLVPLIYLLKKMASFYTQIIIITIWIIIKTHFNTVEYPWRKWFVLLCTYVLRLKALAIQDRHREVGLWPSSFLKIEFSGQICLWHEGEKCQGTDQTIGAIPGRIWRRWDILRSWNN